MIRIPQNKYHLFSVSLWRRANARNVRPCYPYWQYTDLFIFRFVPLLVVSCISISTTTFFLLYCFKLERPLKGIICSSMLWRSYGSTFFIFLLKHSKNGRILKSGSYTAWYLGSIAVFSLKCRYRSILSTRFLDMVSALIALNWVSLAQYMR